MLLCFSVSLWGAVQLGIDFDYIHTKLGELIASDEVRHSTLDQAIFQQMKGIIVLLKRQPSQKQAGNRLMDNISKTHVPPSPFSLFFSLLSSSASYLKQFASNSSERS